MKYYKEVILKNGEKCIISNASGSDAKELYALYVLTHGETNFLTSYPEEKLFNLNKDSIKLEEYKNSHRDFELVARLDGKIIASSGIHPLADKEKIRHRSKFGISVKKDFWGLGIGRHLTKASIDCAKISDYEILELEVVSNNFKAINLYKSLGFIKYGENPKAFKKRDGNYQSLTYMMLELK